MKTSIASMNDGLCELICNVMSSFWDSCMSISASFTWSGGCRLVSGSSIISRLFLGSVLLFRGTWSIAICLYPVDRFFSSVCVSFVWYVYLFSGLLYLILPWIVLVIFFSIFFMSSSYTSSMLFCLFFVSSLSKWM